MNKKGLFLMVILVWTVLNIGAQNLQDPTLGSMLVGSWIGQDPASNQWYSISFMDDGTYEQGNGLTPLQARLNNYPVAGALWSIDPQSGIVSVTGARGLIDFGPLYFELSAGGTLSRVYANPVGQFVYLFGFSKQYSY